MKQDLDLKLQVKQILALIQKTAPGKSVELRIPPYTAIQCVQSSIHRRGTPTNVVEMSATELITLSRNPAVWESLCSTGEITSSGIISDLSEIFTRFAKMTPDLDGSSLGK